MIEATLSPLTGKSATEIDRISTKSIRDWYQHNFDFDVSYLIGGHQSISLFCCDESGLKFFWPVIAGDATFYAALQAQPWYYQEDKHEWSVAEYYTRSKSILEIGCGEAKFAGRSNCQSYVGLELNQEAARVAKKSGLDVRPILSSSHIAEGGGNYDVVCAFQVLEHVSNINEFVEDCIRLCVVDGTIIFSVPNDGGFVGMAADNYLNAPPHHVSRWSSSALSYVANMYSLDVIALREDKLDSIHDRWFADVVGVLVANSLFGRKTQGFFSNGWKDRFCRKIGMSLGRRIAATGDAPRLRPAGHSITAIFRNTETARKTVGS